MPFLTWEEIRDEEVDTNQFLATGTKIDKHIGGFIKSGLIIITGKRKGGKTSFVANIVCNFMNNGYKGLLCSFEMKTSRTKSWIRIMALGDENLITKVLSCGREVYSPKNEFVRGQVDRWINKHLQVYDNSSFKLDKVSADIKSQLERDHEIKFVVLDNLMKLDNEILSEDEYKAQALLVKRLQVFAQKNNICIILVVHPIKSAAFMRLEDIKGSGTIADSADTVIIVHKVTDDFKIASEKYFGWKKEDQILKYDTLLEIAADREFGTEAFCGMYFCKKGKRFLNEPNEKVRYGWQTSKQQEMVIVDNTDLPF